MSTETEVKTVKILVTGGAGFIGSHLMNSLLTKEYDLYCVGVDNFNNYYDPQLKKDRCEEFGLEIRDCDLNDFEKLDMLFQSYEPDIVVHLPHVRVYVIVWVMNICIIEIISKVHKI